jgi:hypothetical protein
MFTRNPYANTCKKKTEKNNDIAKLALVSKGRVRTVIHHNISFGQGRLESLFPKAALAYLVKVAFEKYFFFICAV